jgi:hypothetical protein
MQDGDPDLLAQLVGVVEGALERAPVDGTPS